MTTEDDFQRALDRRRSDWQTRLVFADWLDERGDPRGPGYRAIGSGRFHPRKWTMSKRATWDWWRLGYIEAPSFDNLPDDWFAALVPLADSAHAHADCYCEFATREAAENAAALAFADLPADRQAELLNPTVKRVRRKRARK